MSAPTATHHPLAPLPNTAVAGYGLGDFANTLGFSAVGLFLLLYYADVAALPLWAIAVLFLVVRLWHAVADLLALHVVSRPLARGRLRPFLVGLALPVALLIVLCFNVPRPGQKWLGLISWDASDGVRLTYAVLTYAAFGLAYSLIAVPYGRLGATMTQSPHERSKLVSARAILSVVAILVVAYTVSPVLEYMQRGRVPAEQRLQELFTGTTLGIAVAAAVCYWLAAAWCRETVPRDAPTLRLADLVAALKGNPALRIVSGASVLYLTGLASITVSAAFFADWILGSVSHLPAILLLSSGAGLAVTPFVPWLIERLGKRMIFQFCGLLIVVSGFGLWFIPAQPRGSGITSAFVVALGLFAVSGVGVALVNHLMFGLGPDTVEYGEWLGAARAEEASYAVFTVARRVAQAVGGAVAAALLAIGGYLAGPSLVAAGGTQPGSALAAIRFAIGPFPAICGVLAMIAFMPYPVTEELFFRIRDSNEKRRLDRLAERL